MPGKQKLVIGIIAMIIGIVMLLFGAMAAITYYDGVPKVEDKKELRDEMADQGEDTSAIDKLIEEDEELLESKTLFMGTCLPIGIILMIVGIVLIFLWNKDKKAAPQVSPQQQYQVPPQQYASQQYPPQQYQPPPQYPQQQPTPAPPPSQSPPTKAVTYNCPHCGKPFTVQSTGQPQVVSCPSCGGQTTVT